MSDRTNASPLPISAIETRISDADLPSATETAAEEAQSKPINLAPMENKERIKLRVDFLLIFLHDLANKNGGIKLKAHYGSVLYLMKKFMRRTAKFALMIADCTFSAHSGKTIRFLFLAYSDNTVR
jgi:hypothetical protein